ncbi:MAG: hypothetical protein WCR44_07280, partial [Verrucomicrobiota bacterium]
VGSSNSKATNVFQIASASLLGNDSLYGVGALHNVLQVTGTAQTLTDALFLKTGANANLDQLAVSSGNNLVQLGALAEAALQHGGNTFTLTGGAGADTFDLSSLDGTAKVYVNSSASTSGDSIIAGSGGNTLIGGTAASANNSFLFTGTNAISALTSASIIGGGGTNTLRVDTTGDSFSLSNGKFVIGTDASKGTYSNLSGLDVLYVNGSSDTLNLDGADAAGITTIIGGNGPTTIDGTNYVNGRQNLYWDMSQSNGGDSLLGGAVGNGLVGNVFMMANGANLANSTIMGAIHNGTSATDTLQIVQGAQTLGDDVFANEANYGGNIGALLLGSSTLGGNNITLDGNAGTMFDGGLQPLNGAALTVVGGTQADTIDASTFTQNLWINASKGAGDSLVAGTSGNTLIGATSGGNNFVLGSRINGASLVGASNGLDTLQFTDQVTIYSGDLSTVSKIGSLEFLNSNNTVNLGLDAAKAGIKTVILGQGYDSRGGDNISAAGYGLTPITFEVTDQDYLGKSNITGGNGVDTLRFSRDGISVTDGDFANLLQIEVIQASQVAGSTGNHFLIGNSFSAKSLIGGTGRDTVDLTDPGYTPTQTTSYVLGSGYTILTSSGNLPYTKIIGKAGGNEVTISDTGSFKDALFANQSSANIGTLNLTSDTSTGGNSVALSSNAVAAGITKVNLGDGGDTFDATNFKNKNGQSANLTIIGGAGDDLVQTSFAELANLTFNGSHQGNDTLQLVGTSARAITALNGSYDALALNDGNNFVQLSANGAGISSIFGGMGTDTINLSALNTGINVSVNYAQMTNDSIIGSAGTDTLTVDNNNSQGGNDSYFQRKKSIEAVALTDPKGGFNLLLGTNAYAAGIKAVYGFSGTDADTFNAAGFGRALNFVLQDTLAMTQDKITGSGKGDTLSLASTHQIVSNDYFSGITPGSITSFQLGSSPLTAGDTIGSSVHLGSAAQNAGISSLYGSTSFNDTLTQDFSYGEKALFFKTSSGDNLIQVATAAQLNLDTIIGGTGKNTLQITEDSQSINIATYKNKSNIQTLEFAGGSNSLIISGSINHAIGNTGSDTLNASTISNAVTLDGGVSASTGSGVDLLIGSNSNDGNGNTNTFVLANSAGTYYGTTSEGQVNATNYAKIVNYSKGDTLVLSQADLSATGGPGGVAWGNYSFGKAVNGDEIYGDATTKAHFGFYDQVNGQTMLIADIQADSYGALGPMKISFV